MQKINYDYVVRRPRGRHLFFSGSKHYSIHKEKYGTWYITSGKDVIATTGTLRDAIIYCMQLAGVV